MKNESKSVRIEARVAPSTRRLIVLAAESEGRSVSEFIVAAAQRAAEKTLGRQSVIEMVAEDQKRFAEAILNPPPLNDAMNRAVKRREQLFELS